MKRYFVPVASGTNTPDRMEESMLILERVLRRLGFSPMTWRYKDTDGYLIEADEKSIVGVPGVEVRGSEEWR